MESLEKSLSLWRLCSSNCAGDQYPIFGGDEIWLDEIGAELDRQSTGFKRALRQMTTGGRDGQSRARARSNSPLNRPYRSGRRDGALTLRFFLMRGLFTALRPRTDLVFFSNFVDLFIREMFDSNIAIMRGASPDQFV